MRIPITTLKEQMSHEPPCDLQELNVPHELGPGALDQDSDFEVVDDASDDAADADGGDDAASEGLPETQLEDTQAPIMNEPDVVESEERMEPPASQLDLVEDSQVYMGALPPDCLEDSQAPGQIMETDECSCIEISSQTPTKDGESIMAPGGLLPSNATEMVARRAELEDSISELQQTLNLAKKQRVATQRGVKIELVSACSHSLCPARQLRQAALSLKADEAKGSRDEALMVLDSLPFGSDTLDTQMLPDQEADALAKQFASMDSVTVPSAPTAPKLQL